MKSRIKAAELGNSTWSSSYAAQQRIQQTLQAAEAASKSISRLPLVQMSAVMNQMTPKDSYIVPKKSMMPNKGGISNLSNYSRKTNKQQQGPQLQPTTNPSAQQSNFLEPLVELRPLSSSGPRSINNATDNSNSINNSNKQYTETYRQLQAQLARSHRQSQKLNLIRNSENNSNYFPSFYEPTQAQILEAENRKNDALLQIYTDSGTFSKVVAMTVAASVLDTKLPYDVIQYPLDLKKRDELWKFCHDVSSILGIPDMKALDSNDYRRLWHLFSIFTNAMDQRICSDPARCATPEDGKSNSSISKFRNNINSTVNNHSSRFKSLEETSSDGELIETIKTFNPNLYHALRDPLERFLIVYGRYVEVGQVKKSANLRHNVLNEHIQRYHQKVAFNLPTPSPFKNSAAAEASKAKGVRSRSSAMDKAKGQQKANTVGPAAPEPASPSNEEMSRPESVHSNESVGERNSSNDLDPQKSQRKSNPSTEKKKKVPSWVQAYHSSIPCFTKKKIRSQTKLILKRTSVPELSVQKTEPEKKIRASTAILQEPFLDRVETAGDGRIYQKAHYRGIMPKPRGGTGLSNRRCKTICLDGCRYDVVRRIALENGFKEVGEHDVWNIIWTDVPISLEKALEMRRFQNAHAIFWGTTPPVQKANHFPGMNEICRKDRLARNLNRMKKSFPEDYNFFPRTWSLPADVADLLMYSRLKKNATYICKPDSGCQGKGIFLARNLKKLNPFAKLICQVYIPKPLLIDGYKFDLRIYILITSCDPLRVFIYNEGIARFATVKYSPPNDTNIDVIYMHLTNYSLNKFSQSYDTHGDGSKRKMSAVVKSLAESEYDIRKLQDSIDAVIVKTLIAAQPTLRHYYRASFPKHDHGSACFEILGFDILIDRNLKPYLLEVNHSPSFNLDLPVDAEIKENLLKDTFNIIFMGGPAGSGALEDGKGKKINVKGGKGVPDINTRLSKALQLQIHHENTHCGNYRLIYPIENSNHYGDFFDQTSCPTMADLSKKRIERMNPKSKASNHV